MSITPSGGPAWEKTAGSATYGGSTNKRNFQAQGSINGRTDVSAEEFVRLCEDLRAVVATADFAAFEFTADDTGTADPTLNADTFQSMTSTQPTGSRVSDGVTRWTWGASANDAYAQSGSIHIIGARAQIIGSTAGLAVVSFDDPNADGLSERVTVTLTDTSGTALTDATVFLQVFTGPV